MKVFAYCAESFKEATQHSAGVFPWTCPPVTAETFDVSQLAGNDLLYFDLHGEPGQPAWFGDGGIVALTAEQIRTVDLRGTVVFALSCYLADQGSPMMDALLAAGARYVIGGDGQNWAGVRQLFGASLLGLWFRRVMDLVNDPLWALSAAKNRVAIAELSHDEAKREAARDTLAFRAYYRRM